MPHSPEHKKEHGSSVNNVSVKSSSFPSFSVPAGTAVGAAMRDLELPNKGESAIVCVRDNNGNLTGRAGRVPRDEAGYWSSY